LILLSTNKKVTAMQRELEGLERQIEVHVAAHDRDKNVVNEIDPEVHSLFVQLGCRDNTVPEKFEPTFMTDRNLMRMLGLVDQQTVLLMTMFSNLDQKLSGTIENAGAVESQKKMEDAQRLRHRTSQLSRKPAPPKMGDFDDDSSDDESESEDSTTDSDTDTSSSSSDSEEEFLSKKEKRKKAKRKAEKKAKALEKEMKKRRLSMNAKKRKPNVSPTSRVIDAVQKPESILSLRKKVQRQIENGNHRHHHGSVIRFEPTRGKEHFKKRETGINGTGPMGTALGITPEQLASLQSFGK
jgi:Mg-chelatase subunit ChlI